MDNIDSLSILIPSSPEDASTSGGTSVMTGAGPWECPLCGDEVNFYYLNLEEKLFMCKNIVCQYPFGIEKVILKPCTIGLSCEASSHTNTPNSHSSLMTPTGSFTSSNDWSEKIDRICEETKKQVEGEVYTDGTADIKTTKIGIAYATQENDVQLNELKKELKELSYAKGIIKNEKWIKKLSTLQGSSLLRPQELQQLKSDEKQKCHPGVKINIQPGDENTITSIKIDLQ